MHGAKRQSRDGVLDLTLHAIVENCGARVCPERADKQELLCGVVGGELREVIRIFEIDFAKGCLRAGLFDGRTQTTKNIMRSHVRGIAF